MPATDSSTTVPTLEERASDIAPYLLSPVALFVLPLTVEAARWLAFVALSLLLGTECVPASTLASVEAVSSHPAASPTALLMSVREELAGWTFLVTVLGWLLYMSVKLLMTDEHRRGALRRAEPLLLGLFVFLVAMEAALAALVCASL